MNPVNKFFLFIVLLPSAIYRKMGVNMPQLRAILTSKLIMDDRRPNSVHQTRQKKQDKPIRFATLGTMLMSTLLGIFFLMSFAVGKDSITQFTIFFSFYIFLLASTLITDFTSVLIDVRDTMIILPKPVNDKTFVLSRLLHILIHVSKIVIPMSFPGMVGVTMLHGIAGLLPFIFLVISATLFTIFLINAVYILILRITTPQKFKSIISYFQIAFAILFFGGYQLVPRLLSKVALQNYSVSNASWKWFTPSFWFAASWEFMKTFVFTPTLFTCFLLSVFLPIISMWVVIRYFAPSFNRKLSMISGGEGEPAAEKSGSKKIVSTSSAYLLTMAKLFTVKGAERMSFLHTWKMTGRSRDFKMKVYPTFGYLVIYMVLMVMNNRKLTFADVQSQTAGGKAVFIGILYFSGFILMRALGQLIFSERYKASWIYYITPVGLPGHYISGAMKSIMTRFYLPIILIVSITGLAIAGPTIIPNLVLGMCNQLLIICCVTYITIRQLPFSTTQSLNANTGSLIRGLFSLLIPAVLAVLHYMLYNYLPVIILLTVLSVIACWLVLNGIKSKTWEMILQLNYE